MHGLQLCTQVVNFSTKPTAVPTRIFIRTIRPPGRSDYYYCMSKPTQEVTVLTENVDQASPSHVQRDPLESQTSMFAPGYYLDMYILRVFRPGEVGFRWSDCKKFNTNPGIFILKYLF